LSKSATQDRHARLLHLHGTEVATGTGSPGSSAASTRARSRHGDRIAMIVCSIYTGPGVATGTGSPRGQDHHDRLLHLHRTGVATGTARTGCRAGPHGIARIICYIWIIQCQCCAPPLRSQHDAAQQRRLDLLILTRICEEKANDCLGKYLSQDSSDTRSRGEDRSRKHTRTHAHTHTHPAHTHTHTHTLNRSLVQSPEGASHQLHRYTICALRL